MHSYNAKTDTLRLGEVMLTDLRAPYIALGAFQRTVVVSIEKHVCSPFASKGAVV